MPDLLGKDFTAEGRGSMSTIEYIGPRPIWEVDDTVLHAMLWLTVVKLGAMPIDQDLARMTRGPGRYEVHLSCDDSVGRLLDYVVSAVSKSAKHLERLECPKQLVAGAVRYTDKSVAAIVGISRLG